MRGLLAGGIAALMLGTGVAEACWASKGTWRINVGADGQCAISIDAKGRGEKSPFPCIKPSRFTEIEAEAPADRNDPLVLAQVKVDNRCVVTGTVRIYYFKDVYEEIRIDARISGDHMIGRVGRLNLTGYRAQR